MKILVYGDSILKGIVQNIQDGRKYAVYEDNALSQIGKKYQNLKIINKSVFGSTIQKGHRLLTKDLKDGVNADIALIEYGGNDSDYRWTELCDINGESFIPNTPLDIFMHHLSEMIEEVKENGMKPVLVTLPPLVADRYFNTISEGLDKQKLLSWMFDPWFLYREQELYSNEIMKYAVANNISFLDLRSHFLKRRDCQSLMCEDGIHPNKYGHAFMADFFESVLKSKNIV